MPPALTAGSDSGVPRYRADGDSRNAAVTARVAVGPVAVEVRGEDPRVAPVIKSVRRYLHAGTRPASPAHALRIDVHVDAEAAIPGGGDRLAAFDNGFSLWRDEEAVLLRGHGIEARLDVREGRGTVRVPGETRQGAQRWTGCAVVLESLSILLRRHGLFSVHAAALSREGQGLLLAAAADCGKSTLALRLVQQGWDYLADDTVLLDGTADPVAIRGLRSHFSVDPEAEALFPGIAAGREASLLKEEKWALNVEALYPERRVEVSTPRVLVFPSIVDAEESRVGPVSKGEAFGLLLAQSSLAQVRLDHAADHLDVLGRLVGQARTYRLHAGRDLLADPSRADALLGSLLDATLPVP